MGYINIVTKNGDEDMKITFAKIKNDRAIQSYIKKADESLSAMGFTEHGFSHVGLVADTAGKILNELGFSDRDAELARIAGYLHDIGNVVNRIDHAQSGAVMAFRILDNMNADPDDISTIITAIGNHDESTAFPVNHIAAALIIADKTDVRNSRVREKDISSYDKHDKVNYAVKESKLSIKKTHIELKIKLDTSICLVIEYFEIFLDRMMLCRKAAEKLGIEFWLTINKQSVM